MRTLRIIMVAMTLVGTPAIVWAQNAERAEPAPAVSAAPSKPSCPMMQQMGEMQDDMHEMMQMAPEGELRTRMQAMHEKMDAMMGGMSTSPRSNDVQPDAPVSADGQAHEEHHIPPQ